MWLPFTTFDQIDRFLRKCYEHYTNRDQTETSVLSEYNLAGKRNCKLGRNHCWLCAGRPDMVALARTRRTSYSQFLPLGKTKSSSVGVLFIDALAYWDYLLSVMDEWMSMGDWWNYTERRTAEVRGEKPVSAPLGSPQITQGGQGSNPGLCRERTATNRLSSLKFIIIARIRGKHRILSTYVLARVLQERIT